MRSCPNCREGEPNPKRSHCGYCGWPLDADAEFEATRADHENDMKKEERDA